MSDSIVIAPEGDIDFSRVDAFRATRLDAARGSQNRLVVDRSQVDSIDPSALCVLVELCNRPRREKRQLAVVAAGGTAAAVIVNLSRPPRPIANLRQPAGSR